MAPFISCCAGVCVQRVTATTAATAPVHVSDSDEELEAGGLPAARGFRAGAREIDDVLRDMHRAQRFHLARGIVEAQHGDPTTVRGSGIVARSTQSFPSKFCWCTTATGLIRVLVACSW